MKQIRRGIGKYLKKLREERKLSLTEVSAYLSTYKIKCVRTNLTRLETKNTTIRHDILAGLSIIYDVSADEILFRERK